MTENFQIPLSLSTRTDLYKLIREAEELTQQVHSKLTKNESKDEEHSRTLLEIAEINDIKLTDTVAVKSLNERLQVVLRVAPVMHLSFASAPEVEFVQRLTKWFRQEIHPYSILSIGLQPSIAAGCTLRTTSKYFDFSIRNHLAKQSSVLGQKLQGIADA